MWNVIILGMVIYQSFNISIGHSSVIAGNLQNKWEDLKPCSFLKSKNGIYCNLKLKFGWLPHYFLFNFMMITYLELYLWYVWLNTHWFDTFWHNYIEISINKIAYYFNKFLSKTQIILFTKCHNCRKYVNMYASIP